MQKDGSLEKHSDIWSFGSLIYKLFTGEYILESEYAHHLPSEKGVENYVNELLLLYADKAKWNRTIEGKISKAKMAKPFKNLLKRCLVDERYRIQDASELERELNRAMFRYEHNRPMRRFLRLGVYAGILGTIIASAALQVNSKQENIELTAEVEKSEAEIERYKKLRTAKLYLLGNRSDSSWADHVGLAEIKAWEEMLGDRKTAIAAYLDPDFTYEAIQENGGKTDYENIMNYMINNNDALSCSFYELSCSPDFIARDLARQSPDKVEKLWEEAKIKYERKKAISQ
jgi:serine/threonine protein kinase